MFNKFRIIKNSWILPIILGIIVSVVVQPVFAGMIQTSTTHQVKEIGSEVVEGYQHIYIVRHDGAKTFITDGGQNNLQLHHDNAYATWVDVNAQGQGNIILYSFTTNSTMQLTFNGQHQHPFVSQGRVVWETWQENSWQISLFDGNSVKQISSGLSSISPQIEENTVIFSQRDTDGNWQLMKYTIPTQQTEEIADGPLTKRATIKDGQIVLLTPVVQKTISPSMRPLATPAAPIITETSIIDELSNQEDINNPEQTLEEITPSPSIQPATEPSPSPVVSPPTPPPATPEQSATVSAETSTP